MYSQKLVRNFQMTWTSGWEPARFCLSHLEGDKCTWILRQDSSTTPVCNPGTVQCSAPLLINPPVAGPLEIQGYLFFSIALLVNSSLGSQSLRNLGNLQQCGSQVCLCQNWKPVVSRLTPSPGVTFLAVLFYTCLRLSGLCPLQSAWGQMVQCCYRHSVLDLSIRVPGAGMEQGSGCKQDCQSIPSFSWLKCKLSQAEVGQVGHTVLHICPRKLWLLLTLMSWSLPLHSARSRRMWLPGQDIMFHGMLTHTCLCADVRHITSSY